MTARPLNIMDFGAKGDGWTDDRAAFEAMCKAALKDGLTAVVPPGDYRIDQAR